jgi:hypothetical protein
MDQTNDNAIGLPTSLWFRVLTIITKVYAFIRYETLQTAVQFHLPSPKFPRALVVI